MYIGFKTSFYVVRHLDSIAPYLPTGLHLGLLRSWPSFYLPSSFSSREGTVIKETEQNQLTWYGHVQRMAERRLPKIALKWMPKQKRTRGRPKKNWMEDIRKAMNEKNLNEGQWEDRKQCSLGVG